MRLIIIIKVQLSSVVITRSNTDRIGIFSRSTSLEKGILRALIRTFFQFVEEQE